MTYYTIVAEDVFNKRKIFEFGQTTAQYQCRWKDIKKSFKRNLDELAEKCEYLQPIKIIIVQGYVEEYNGFCHDNYRTYEVETNGVALEIIIDLFKAHISNYQTIINQKFDYN